MPSNRKEQNKNKQANKSKENNNNNNNNKNEGRKAVGGGKDAKRKSYFKTSFADILHLEWVTKCLIYKQNVGRFWIIIARQWKNSLIGFRRWFLAKFPGANGWMSTFYSCFDSSHLCYLYWLLYMWLKRTKNSPKHWLQVEFYTGLCFWFYITSLGMHIVWFNFILGLKFIFLCLGVW